jgi:hypothetical protein
VEDILPVSWKNARKDIVSVLAPDDASGQDNAVTARMVLAPRGIRENLKFQFVWKPKVIVVQICN